MIKTVHCALLFIRNDSFARVSQSAKKTFVWFTLRAIIYGMKPNETHVVLYGKKAFYDK